MGRGRDKRKRAARKQKSAPVAIPPALEQPPGFEDPDALVFATLKPKPKSGAGAVALPEPEELIFATYRGR